MEVLPSTPAGDTSQQPVAGDRQTLVDLISATPSSWPEPQLVVASCTGLDECEEFSAPSIHGRSAGTCRKTPRLVPAGFARLAVFYKISFIGALPGKPLTRHLVSETVVNLFTEFLA